MKVPSLITAVALAFGVFALMSGGAEAQEQTVRKSDLVRLLGQLPEYTPIRRDMKALGFRGEKLDLAVAQIEKMLNDPMIAGNIADRVLAAQQPTVQSVEAGGLFWPLVDRGLGHLPLRDMRYFYVVEQTMLKAMPERDCGLVIRERLSPARRAKVTGSVAARLNTPALKEYYRIQFRAAQLGATRGPARLTAADEARTVQKINAALARTLKGRNDARALQQAFGDLDHVGNRRACRVGRLFMDTVLAMEGRDLHHALILLSAP